MLESLRKHPYNMNSSQLMVNMDSRMFTLATQERETKRKLIEITATLRKRFNKRRAVIIEKEKRLNLLWYHYRLYSVTMV